MSAGGSADGAAAGAVNSTHLLIMGIVGGLLCIYLSGFLGDIVGPVIAAIGAVLAIVWGADAIRRVASYGLGTGVPSIGYMSLYVGVISALAGISLATILNMTIAGPVLALVIAIIIGAIIALIATKIVGMKIPIMLQCTIEIACAACLAIFAFSTAIVGIYDIHLRRCCCYWIYCCIIYIMYYGYSTPIQRMFRTKRRSSQNFKMCCFNRILIHDYCRYVIFNYWWIRMGYCISRRFNRLGYFIQSIRSSFM